MTSLQIIVRMAAVIKKRRKRGPKQMSFFKEVPRLFGGALQKSHSKFARPLSTKESIHLVLKSDQAVGPRSMLYKHNADKIDSLVRRQADICKIRIYQLVNVGNHLHLVIKLDNHRLFARFIRAITGVIARHVLKKQRGYAKKNLKLVRKDHRVATTQFWVARPFTRLVAWGRDYNYVKRYMDKNRDQARGKFVAWGFDVVEESKIELLNAG